MSIRIPDELTRWHGHVDEDLTEAINEYLMFRTQAAFLSQEINALSKQKQSLWTQVQKSEARYKKLMQEIIKEQSA
jgi:hypothetical protein